MTENVRRGGRVLLTKVLPHRKATKYFLKEFKGVKYGLVSDSAFSQANYLVFISLSSFPIISKGEKVKKAIDALSTSLYCLLLKGVL